MIRFFSAILFFAFILAGTIWGQYIIPVNIQRSIDKGFRTKVGVPGENYFQNRSEYKIHTHFDPKSGKITGTANITYFNNSPDTLRKIVLRLYQNIARKGGIRDEEWDEQNLHDGVRITNLKLENDVLTNNLKHRTKTTGTNFIVFLSEPLDPAGSLNIGIDWNFTMPSTGVHRYGKYGKGTYFVSFWYPQVSVYDDIDGWDRKDYTGTHEFYNDFNSYDVRIKVPKGFMVWAAGDWMNAERILQSEIVQRRNKAGTTDEVIHIITKTDWDNRKIFTRKGANSFHFKADSIPDFAFGISDNYLWDGSSVLIDSADSRRVVVNAAYEPGSAYFDSVASYGCNVIRHFSSTSFQFPFPYNQITVFNGEGGMEYPMIVNNGTSFSRKTTIFLTMHELAHSYFPFLTGINERKYSWVDEGLTTYLPIETEIAMKSDYYPLEGIVRKYSALAGTESDIPFSVPAYQTRGWTYQYYSYIRSSMAFNMLERYIGRQDFRHGISDFIQTWQYKHSTPYDLFAVLKRNTDKDIDWFIDQWFFQRGWPDLSVGQVEYRNDSISVEINCDGTFAVPVLVKLIAKNGESIIDHISPEIWKNSRNYLYSRKVDMEITEIQLGDKTLPDITPHNNIYIFE